MPNLPPFTARHSFTRPKAWRTNSVAQGTENQDQWQVAHFSTLAKMLKIYSIVLSIHFLGQSKVDSNMCQDLLHQKESRNQFFLPADFGVNLSLLAAQTASSLYPRSRSKPCCAATLLTTCKQRGGGGDVGQREERKEKW